MVATVARISVAKCPDSGATRTTRGCVACTSFLKRSRVPKGVTRTGSSVTFTSRLPTVTEWMSKGGRQAGPRDDLIGGREIAHQRMIGQAAQPGTTGPGNHPGQNADRLHQVAMGLIDLVKHPPPPHAPRKR